MNSLDAGRDFVDDGEDIFFRDDEVFGAVNLDFAARILAIKDAITDFDAHSELRAVLQHAAIADGLDDALLGLLFSGVGQKNAARRFIVLLDVLDNDVIVQGLEIHGKNNLHSGPKND